MDICRLIFVSKLYGLSQNRKIELEGDFARREVAAMDVVEFFRQSAGKWRSQRTTHHLAFRRSELGESNIEVVHLEADHPDIVALCHYHQVDPSLAVGGSRVNWLGTMAWDRSEEENHEGKTVFAIVPDAENPRCGKLLRERGYAEIVPVAGRYEMDDQDGLILSTEYESMSAMERFSFVGPNTRMRTSTVKRFGGFSSATFCTETRVEDETAAAAAESAPAVATPQFLFGC